MEKHKIKLYARNLGMVALKGSEIERTPASTLCQLPRWQTLISKSNTIVSINSNSNTEL